MKKATFFITLFLGSVFFSFGQYSDNSIRMEKASGRYQFYQNNKKLSMAQVVNAMESNEVALKQIKAAESNKTLSNIIGYAGGFMLGWPIGTAIGGGKPNWALAGIGAGLVVVAIPINQKVAGHYLSAIDSFNESQKSTSSRQKPEFKLGFTGNALALTWLF